MRIALLIGTIAAASLMGCSTLQGLVGDESVDVHVDKEGVEVRQHEAEAAAAEGVAAPQAAAAKAATPAPAPQPERPVYAVSEGMSPGQPARVRVFLTSEKTPKMCVLEQETAEHVTYACGPTGRTRAGRLAPGASDE